MIGGFIVNIPTFTEHTTWHSPTDPRQLPLPLHATAATVQAPLVPADATPRRNPTPVAAARIALAARAVSARTCLPTGALSTATSRSGRINAQVRARRRNSPYSEAVAAVKDHVAFYPDRVDAIILQPL